MYEQTMQASLRKCRDLTPGSFFLLGNSSNHCSVLTYNASLMKSVEHVRNILSTSAIHLKKVKLRCNISQTDIFQAFISVTFEDHRIYNNGDNLTDSCKSVGNRKTSIKKSLAKKLEVQKVLDSCI